MKYVLITLLFVCSNKSYSSAFIETDNEIKLESYHKTKTTFSGELNDLNSLHLIIAKNTQTKGFDIIPSIFNFKGQNIKQYNAISFNKQPSIVSFHSNNNIISLITSIKVDKEDFIRVIDMNIGSGEIKTSKDISKEDLKTSIRRKNKTILIYSFKEKIELIDIENSNSIKSINVTPSVGAKSVFESIFKTSLDVIRYDEFIKHGSIRKNRLYAKDTEIIITTEYVDKNETKVVKIPLNKESDIEVDAIKFKNDEKELTKKSTSFVINNKLYQFKTNKNIGEILVFNLDNGEESEIQFSESNIYNKSKKLKNLESFFKIASKTNYEPTITLNRTKSNNYLMRLDYVFASTYNYIDWHHFHWQQNQFFNQPQITVPSRFGGPSVEFYDKLAFNENQIIPKKYYFNILIDSNDTILNNVQDELVYKNIDKQKYKDIINNSFNYKYSSYIFLKNQFRYFVYHKDSKSFRVFKKDLDD